MGCDIHCFVEVKKDEKWEDYSDYIPPINRNYQLFALLADVRNGSGFAGCDTGDPIIPISQPKGLPEDCSDSAQEHYEYWVGDGHSHSWLTLREILEYDKSQLITRRGFVTAEKYKDYLETGDPYPCCGGVGGGMTEIVDKDVAITYQELNPDKHVYCQIEWTNPIFEELNYFYEEVIPALQEQSNTKDYSDVRIVFWFDN